MEILRNVDVPGKEHVAGSDGAVRITHLGAGSGSHHQQENSRSSAAGKLGYSPGSASAASRRLRRNLPCAYKATPTIVAKPSIPKTVM